MHCFVFAFTVGVERERTIQSDFATGKVDARVILRAVVLLSVEEKKNDLDQGRAQLWLYLLALWSSQKLVSVRKRHHGIATEIPKNFFDQACLVSFDLVRRAKSNENKRGWGRKNFGGGNF